MICPKCGTFVPDGRETCVNCGSQMQKPSMGDDTIPDPEKDQEKTAVSSGGFGLFKDGWGRGAIMGSALIGLLMGGVLAGVIWYFIGYAVFLWVPAVTVFSLVVVAGGLIQMLGFHRTGGIMMILAGLPLCLTLFGIISVVGGVMALKNGKTAAEARINESDIKKKFKGSHKIRTGIVEKVVLGVLIAFIIVVPVASVGQMMNAPLIRISDLNLPDSYSGTYSGGIIDITITLENIGSKKAEADSIEITVTTDTSNQHPPWEGGDLESGEEGNSQLRVSMSGSFQPSIDRILIKYDGQRMHLKMVGQTYSSW